MSFSKRDTLVYRQDEKYGHQLLTPQQRIELVKPYLPSPKSRSPNRPEAETSNGHASRFGLRRFFLTKLHLLLYILIHAIFSLYIRIRQGYHAVRDRIWSILYYHHRTPGLIQRDVKHLSRLPKHLSVILKLEESKGGAELERLVDEAADITAWCASAGIPELTIYEKTGVLKGYLPAVHRAISQNLAAYFGKQHPTLTLGAPHVRSIESSASPRAGRFAESSLGHISIRLISAEDGRDSVVDLTKTLTDMVQLSKISASDISIELLDAELTEGVMSEPDLLILFSPWVELSSYPPWQVRLTEIFHAQDNESVGYQVFYRGLCKYANAQMRFGR
ncbi:Undecaprenyl diphosphate synthase [Pleurostoma richardsiae]|uniref:ditrans,polycis-polyprenyl diphosphate synthase [(2E,6E)-farnesyldiphosphate specific] n=1 Tax=Pleurostoma richardsiae TaxID=41990 RepID=A0AA38S6S5_9PEZI|nr:Undecaprenyl diphosphate synthase [Pleurostoma richardsiae]